MKTIDRSQLDHWTDESRPFALLDVLPDEPGQRVMPATTNERAFDDPVASLGADKEQAVVLYECATARLCTTAMAELLHEAGFHNVYHFTGPHAAIHASGHESRTH